MFGVAHDAGTTEYPGSTLLVGIDETGHEEFADSQHPVFGLGGCAVLIRHYWELIDEPWRNLKAEHFGGAEVALHAADLRGLTPDQLEALGQFFANQPFFRFATMAASTLSNETGLPLVQILAGPIWEQIAEIAKWTQPTEIFVVIEDSARLRSQLYGYIAGWQIGNEGIRIKPRVFLVGKERKQSFMEVADFVMHAAGGQVRSRVFGRLNLCRPVRQDFEAVFHPAESRLAQFRELLEVRDGAQQHAARDV